jgi:glutamate-1-semialdehyde 2,1-aminomutase
LAVAAGIAMLRHIEGHPEVYAETERRVSELVAAVPRSYWVNRVGSMFTIFFQDGPVRDYTEAKRSDAAQFGRFFHYLLDRGIYFPPSQFEAAFMSGVHTAADISYTAETIRAFFSEHA